MKVKVIGNLSAYGLEENINEFIKDKDVIEIRDLPQDSNMIYTLIVYEDRPKKKLLKEKLNKKENIK